MNSHNSCRVAEASRSMASSSALLLALPLLLCIIPVPLMGLPATRCFTSIFSFGDSIADTGNQLILEGGASRYGHEPYGETFFLHPTGRASDGRLIVDFIEAMGLPLLPPFLSGTNVGDFRRGVNFAVAGATAMGNDFFRKKGLQINWTNISLGVQLEFFKGLLPSLCSSDSECNNLLSRSLILMGTIGGNDYNHAFFQGRTLQEIKPYVPYIIYAISSAITELISIGARTLVVPGILPNGCLAIYLTLYQSSRAEDYSSSTGCINWLNDFAELHDKALKEELIHLRLRHPNATIIYADYYSAFMDELINSANKSSLGRHPLAACCGNGGSLYNFDLRALCGTKKMSACDNPSGYLSWDGIHLTEAAYMAMAGGLLHGPFAVPSISQACSFIQPTIVSKTYDNASFTAS